MRPIDIGGIVGLVIAGTIAVRARAADEAAVRLPPPRIAPAIEGRLPDPVPRPRVDLYARPARGTPARPAAVRGPRLEFQPYRIIVLHDAPARAAVGSPPDDFDVGEEPPPTAEPPAIVDAQTFDRWVFGNLTDQTLRWRWLEERLDDRLTRIREYRPLSQEQAATLRLAGRGDIARLLQRIERERSRFGSLRDDLGKSSRFLRVELRPVCDAFERGPFLEGSLLTKTLTTIDGERLGQTAR